MTRCPGTPPATQPWIDRRGHAEGPEIGGSPRPTPPGAVPVTSRRAKGGGGNACSSLPSLNSRSPSRNLQTTVFGDAFVLFTVIVTCPQSAAVALSQPVNPPLPSSRVAPRPVVSLAREVSRIGRSLQPPSSTLRCPRERPASMARPGLRDSPRPCRAYGVARPAERLVSMALRRPSLIRMRALVQGGCPGRRGISVAA